MDRVRHMDQNQLMAFRHRHDTRSTRTRKPSQFRRKTRTLGISAQRGSQNDALTFKRNTDIGEKKKDNNQFWDSDSSMVQIWLFALICTKTRFKVSSQSKTTSAENSDIHLALNHNRMLSNYYVSILQTDFVRGKVVAFFIFCFLCKKFKFDSLASDWSFAYCSYLPFKKKNVFFLIRSK